MVPENIFNDFSVGNFILFSSKICSPMWMEVKWEVKIWSRAVCLQFKLSSGTAGEIEIIKTLSHKSYSIFSLFGGIWTFEFK